MADDNPKPVDHTGALKKCGAQLEANVKACETAFPEGSGAGAINARGACITAAVSAFTKCVNGTLGARINVASIGALTVSVSAESTDE
jgi:hypothetical protein